VAPHRFLLLLVVGLMQKEKWKEPLGEKRGLAKGDWVPEDRCRWQRSYELNRRRESAPWREIAEEEEEEEKLPRRKKEEENLCFFFFFFLLVFVQVGLCDLFSFRRFEVTADSVVLAVSLVG